MLLKDLEELDFCIDLRESTWRLLFDKQNRTKQNQSLKQTYLQTFSNPPLSLVQEQKQASQRWLMVCVAEERQSLKCSFKIYTVGQEGH